MDAETQKHVDWIGVELRDELQFTFGPTGMLSVITGEEFAMINPEVRNRYATIEKLPQTVIVVAPVDEVKDPTMHIWIILKRNPRTFVAEYEVEFFDNILSLTQSPLKIYHHPSQRIWAEYNNPRVSLDAKDLITLRALIFPKVISRRQHHERRVDYLDALARFDYLPKDTNANQLPPDANA